MSKTKTKIINAWQFVKKGNTLMVMTVVFLMMAMLVSTNYANSQSLERNELEKQIRLAEDDVRLSNAEVSKLQTTERIEQESQKMDLVKIQAQDIYYLASGQDLVALK